MFPGEEVKIRIDFWMNDAGVGAIMDFPGGPSLRLANVRFRSSKVHFEQIGAQGAVNRLYDGEQVEDKISGESVQLGIFAPFTLKRLEADLDSVALEPGLNSLMFRHSGLTRRLLVRLPESFQPNVVYPVVFFFQGSLGTAEGFFRTVSRSSVNMEDL